MTPLSWRRHSGTLVRSGSWQGKHPHAVTSTTHHAVINHLMLPPVSAATFQVTMLPGLLSMSTMFGMPMQH